MCIVYTSRIGYRGPDGLDITVKSAQGISRSLAPTWELVGGIKGWRGYPSLTVAQYTDSFYALLRRRYRTDDRPFLDILEREAVVLLCYCPQQSAFCHRSLAVNILEKTAQARGLPFTYGGELPLS